MITEQDAVTLARQAMAGWEPDGQPRELEVRRLPHGWRCEVVRTGPQALGRSHAGVTAVGQVVRIPDGGPDDVADEILAGASTDPEGDSR